MKHPSNDVQHHKYLGRGALANDPGEFSHDGRPKVTDNIVETGEDELLLELRRRHPEKMMRCGSRDQNPVADRAFPGDDTWETRGDGTRVCSFCGSLHEDDFIDIVEHYVKGDEGYSFDPSTKAYKFYAHRPGTSNGSVGGIKFYTWHIDVSKVESRKDLIQRACKKFYDELQAKYPNTKNSQSMR